MQRKIRNSGPRPQMPGLLARIDDPYGIVWRLSNLIRRFNPIQAARFAAGLGVAPDYRKPVMIIGMPRAGTTLLFQVLRDSPALVSLPTEGHNIWRAFHHPRYWAWRSDLVGHGSVQPGERRFIRAYLYSHLGAGRLLEKTADNCVRVPYLLDLFPDAVFVVIKRNPCDGVNSYINMWRDPQNRFRSYFLPTDLRIPGYPYRRAWCSTLIDGWRELTAAPIPEIAFAQWLTYVSCIEAARSIVPRAQFVEVYLEDILRSPLAIMSMVTDRIGVEMDRRLQQKAADLVTNPVNALSAPRQDKWREQNHREVTALLPRIAAHSARLGYSVDPHDGECVPCPLPDTGVPLHPYPWQDHPIVNR